MPIDFDAPEWRARVMQDKADVLGLQVRLLWTIEGEDAGKKPWIQFLEREERRYARPAAAAVFELDEAERRLEDWLDYFNETGRRHQD